MKTSTAAQPQAPKTTSQYFEWSEWSLQRQLATVVMFIGFVVVLGITATFTIRQNQTLRNQLEERAITTLVSVDAANIDELYFYNVDQIKTITSNFVESTDILLIRIYDSTGRLLVATDDATLGASINIDPFGFQLIESNNPQLDWQNDHLVAGKAVMVANQTLGAVHIELSTSELNRQLQINLLQGFIAAILVGLFGGLAVIFVSRSLTAPIAALVNQTKSIAAGDFTQSISVTGGSREITELTNSIEDMRKNLKGIYSELEQRVVERTAELKVARDEAVAAQQIANENSRLKSEFLSTMSHELRTPMNAIEGFTGIMLNKMGGVEYNEKAERYLTKVQSNSKRLLGLINDFLDLSRIESGRLELAHHAISPKEMVRKWEDNLSVLADNKGLELTVSVDTALPETIFGDEESLSKIAINLIGNAIKFTSKGTVSLKLEKRGDQMALEVRDTGIGIPPHAREFVFDEFRQVDQSSKREYGGTGLGLAIVQKLAREMGGVVTLDSEVGVGSTFTVLLPIHSEKQVA